MRFADEQLITRQTDPGGVLYRVVEGAILKLGGQPFHYWTWHIFPLFRGFYADKDCLRSAPAFSSRFTLYDSNCPRRRSLRLLLWPTSPLRCESNCVRTFASQITKAKSGQAGPGFCDGGQRRIAFAPLRLSTVAGGSFRIKLRSNPSLLTSKL